MLRPSCILLAALALGAQERPQLVQGVRVFDGERVRPETSVLFQHGRILALGGAAPAGAEVVDGRGCTLLPGLVDAHTHTFGGAARQALRFGVTTELDMFSDPRMSALQRQRDLPDEADLRTAGYLATVPGGHGSQYLPVPTVAGPREAQAWVDARLAEGSDYLKLVVARDAGRPSLDAATVRALIQAAHARKRLAVVHAENMGDAVLALEAGADVLAHVPGRGGAEPEAFLALAAARRVPVIATLGVTGGALGPHPLLEDAGSTPFLDPEMRATLRRLRAPGEAYLQGLETLRALRARGVPVLCGTDALNRGVAHGASLHEELERLATAGFTPAEALACATSEPCRVFGLGDRGRIKPGLRADLLLVHGDPTRDILATRRIAAVWKAGLRLDRRPVEAPPVLKVLPAWDFEARQDWMPSTDAVMGGSSGAELRIGALPGRGHALHVTGAVKPGAPRAWAGALVFLGATPFAPVDLGAAKSVRLRLRGAAAGLGVQLYSQAGGFIPSVVPVACGPDWTEVRIPLERFRGLDPGSLTALGVAATTPGPVDVWIDDVAFE